ncbi:hypothetical protein A2U01_0049025, partial [Trifolium medium]|nr:hypothetical protein [Trifolium medium]
VDTPPPSGSPVKELPKPKPPDVKVETQNVKFEPSDFGQIAKVLSRREPPAKPPDLSVSVDGGGYTIVDAERRRIQLRPPPKPPERKHTRLKVVAHLQPEMMTANSVSGESLHSMTIVREKRLEETRYWVTGKVYNLGWSNSK